MESILNADMLEDEGSLDRDELYDFSESEDDGMFDFFTGTTPVKPVTCEIIQNEPRSQSSTAMATAASALLWPDTTLPSEGLANGSPSRIVS